MQKLKTLAQSLEGLGKFLDQMSQEYDRWPADRLIELERQSHEAYKVARALDDLNRYLEA